MFNKNFYPTPRELCIQMLEPHIRYMCGRYCLEPSAGKGNLVDVANELIEKYNNDFARSMTAKIHTIEIEPELRATLAGKDYTIIGEDFMAFNPNYCYEFIFANPPFEGGEKHFLRAWDILASGGRMVFLLNAQTLKNPHTKERQMLVDLIATYGNVKYIENAFSDAERKTNVEVVLINVRKPEHHGSTLEWGGFTAAKNDTDGLFTEKEHTELVTPSVIANTVFSYNSSVDALKRLFKAVSEFKYHLSGLGYVSLENIMKSVSRLNSGGYNEAVEQVRKAAWDGIFDRTNLKSRLTSSIIRDFNKYQQTQHQVEVTQENIEKFRDLILQGASLIKQRCIEETFEWLTSFHPTNKVHTEGWKSNSHYKVNNKVVVPGLSMCRIFGKFEYLHDGVGNKFDDLDKALCFITGKKFDEIKTISKTIQDEVSYKLNGDVETEFFYAKFYKKGTAHLKFKDQAVLDALNLQAAKYKKWIG